MSCVVQSKVQSQLQNFRFVLGGLSRCFNCSIPRASSKVIITPENSKKGCLCTLLPPQLSLSPSLASQSFLAFVFKSISASSYLPRAKMSAPRRSHSSSFLQGTRSTLLHIQHLRFSNAGIWHCPL
jgi:hypothetical protein